MSRDAPPILSLEAIHKRFGAIVIADGIDIALAPGEALGIIGPNGAGKTTLFGIISGAISADTGRVLLDGEDITRLPPEQRCRRGIARSFQVPQPFVGMTVFENLAVAASFATGRREADVYRDCAMVLDRCSLADKSNRLAGSLTLLDRKRLELARALATTPRILLLDEVAGGLTEDECGVLVTLVKSIRDGGVAVIWIEHIVHALAAVVTRIAVLAGGTIIAEGTPPDVIRNERVREIYMGLAVDE